VGSRGGAYILGVIKELLFSLWPFGVDVFIGVVEAYLETALNEVDAKLGFEGV
jgi:hypothetical protein